MEQLPGQVSQPDAHGELFEHARSLWAETVGVGADGEPVRPEGVFAALIDTYASMGVADVPQHLTEFAAEHGQTLRQIVEEHSPGSPRYVQHRDWLYVEPETLLIADLARTRSREVQARLAGSDYERIVTVMLAEFRDTLTAHALQ